MTEGTKLFLMFTTVVFYLVKEIRLQKVSVFAKYIYLEQI